ncbi:maleylacetate reductase [Azospirillum sp. ST 5-10]|uniref:maleylacetate reductase n=1 Tax=unclassified Azospirillum TaxID=2630922 RepID=UPI003F4A54A8
MDEHRHAGEGPAGLRFVHSTAPQRVVFGCGAAARLAEEAAAVGCRRVLLVSMPRLAAVAGTAARNLGAACAGRFDVAVQHVPHEVAVAAAEAADAVAADGVLAVGGGSAIGVGKAVALLRRLPLLALPTTYAGSEMTPILGMTRDGVKTTQRDEAVRPRLVVYDPDLLRDLRLPVAVVSAANALAHCVEALWAHDRNPIDELMAEEGLRALVRGLRSIADTGDAAAAADGLLYGAWLGGAVLGSTSMALHHKLCHTLGGLYALPHAETHAAVLPHVVAYNGRALPRLMERLAALGLADAAGDVAGGLFDLLRRCGAAMRLADLGFPAEGAAAAARQATVAPYPNPRSFDADAVATLLRDARDGRRPVTGR